MTGDQLISQWIWALTAWSLALRTTIALTRPRTARAQSIRSFRNLTYWVKSIISGAKRRLTSKERNVNSWQWNTRTTPSLSKSWTLLVWPRRAPNSLRTSRFMCRVNSLLLTRDLPVPNLSQATAPSSKRSKNITRRDVTNLSTPRMEETPPLLVPDPTLVRGASGQTSLGNQTSQEKATSLGLHQRRSRRKSSC